MKSLMERNIGTVNRMKNRLSTNLDYIMSARFGGTGTSAAEAAKLCLDAGFRVVDYSPDIRRDDWKERVTQDAAAIRALGMDISQTHAPFNRYTKFPTEVFHEHLDRHFQAALILGVPRTVVHGNEYGLFPNGYDRKPAGDYAYEILAPHVEYALKHGLGVAVENLQEGRSFPEESTRLNYTAETEEVLELIHRFNDPLVTCCWDFGHAHVAYDSRMLDELKKVGPLLSCTHIHDNYYQQDLHLPPFMGDIDWKSHMRYLRESGYAGDITFEMVYGHIPAEMCGEFLASLYHSGELLLELGAE